MGVEQHDGHGFANDVRAPHNDRSGAGHGDAGMLEQLHHAGRGAGAGRGRVGHKLADVEGVKSVHVLVRADRSLKPATNWVYPCR